MKTKKKAGRKFSLPPGTRFTVRSVPYVEWLEEFVVNPNGRLTKVDQGLNVDHRPEVTVDVHNGELELDFGDVFPGNLAVEDLIEEDRSEDASDHREEVALFTCGVLRIAYGKEADLFEGDGNE